MFSRNGPTFAELVEQALSSTERGYDKLAPKFDETPFRTPQGLIDRCLRDLGPVDRSLDLCCGTGGGLLALRELTKQRVVGVDFSAGMLAVAEAELGQSRGLPRIELVRRDVLSLDYSNEFDLVTCFGAFGHILPEDEPQFVSIIRRALVPGGRFVFITAERPPSLSLRNVIARAFNATMRIRNRFVSPPFIMYYLTFSLPEVGSLLRSHGFEVEIERNRFDGIYRELVRVIATNSGAPNRANDRAEPASE